MIIAAVVMATGVTPVDQEMAAEQSDEVKLAKPPPQGLSQDHPGPEVPDSSIAIQEAAALKKANAIQKEHFETEKRDFGVSDKLRQLTKLPGFGVLLAILCVLWGQAGAVVVKKMTLHPFILLLWRDLLRLTTQDTPLMLMYGEDPFPKGSRLLLVLRAIATGLNVAGRTYAVRYLPIADVTMIASIRPVCVSLLSCIFLKEACGIFEMITLCLVFTGVTLVIQPPFIFGTEHSEYTPHMMYTALMLIIITAISSAVPIVLRHLRRMHWAALGGSARFITIFEHLSVVLFLGIQCLPECGEERLLVLVLSVIGTLVQTTQTLSLKYEEAHVISLVDNATNIIVSFLLQAVFFDLSLGPVKLVGALVVLVSVILIGGRQVWKAKKSEKQ